MPLSHAKSPSITRDAIPLTTHGASSLLKRRFASAAVALVPRSTASLSVLHSWRIGDRTHDHIGILLNTPVTGKEAHSRDTCNALLNPRILVLVRFVYKRMRLDVAVKIV